MTDHSDLIARLRAHVRDRGGMSRDAETGEIVLPNGAWAMMLAAADALSSQSLSLSEARARGDEYERLYRQTHLDYVAAEYKAEAATAELSEAREEIERLRGLLHANGKPRFNEAMRRLEAAEHEAGVHSDAADGYRDELLSLRASLRKGADVAALDVATRALNRIASRQESHPVSAAFAAMTEIRALGSREDGDG